MFNVLRTRTVASSIVFPQWPRFNSWRARGAVSKKWEAKSRKWLLELVRLMQPKVILTYGAPAYMELTGGSKSKGKLAEGNFDGIPVIGCGHPVQGADLEERSEAMTLLGNIIK